jgi:2-iminobutanoate/2-iminopropanoate deaminase
MLFVSGQIAINPKTDALVNENIINETQQVMQNIKAILEAAGLSFSNIIKTSIFLIDMNDFAQVNEIYGSYFNGDYPARETVQVSKLPKGAHVEISVIAAR